MAATTETVKKIMLKSSDGGEFEVDEAVALESQTIKRLIEENYENKVISLSDVPGAILSKVIEYCKKHVEHKNKPSSNDTPTAESDEELEKWDAEFVKVDQDTVFALVIAANNLNIKSLLDLTCQTVAEMIKGKSPAEIRKTFNIKENFTPEEEDEVRRQHGWDLQ